VSSLENNFFFSKGTFGEVNSNITINKIFKQPNGFKSSFNLFDYLSSVEKSNNPARVSINTVNFKKTFESSYFKKTLDMYSQSNIFVDLKNNSSNNSFFIDGCSTNTSSSGVKNLIVLNDFATTNNFLLNNDTRLVKFFIENTFVEFKNNEWVYFSLLPESYKTFLYKFKLLTDSIYSDTST